MNGALESYDTSTNTAVFEFNMRTNGNDPWPSWVLKDAWYRASLTTDDLPLSQDWVKDFSMRQGDATGDGAVNFDDYTRIDNGFNHDLIGYTNGDFDYSGEINFDDYVIIDSTYGTVLKKPPTAPHTLAASGISPTETQLNWKTDIVGAEGWRVQYSADGQTFSVFANIMGDASNFTATGLTEGTRYFWRVRAFGNEMDSAYTAKKSAVTVLPAPTVDPQIFAASDSVTVYWGANSQNADNYAVQVLEGKTPIITNTMPSISTVYTATGLQANTEYSVRVSASNSVAQSSWTHRQFFTTQPTGSASPILPASQSVREVYVNGERSGATASWSNPNAMFDAFQDETLTLSVSGLPQHTQVAYYFRISHNTFGTNMSVNLGGEQVADLEGTGGWWYGGSDGSNGVAVTVDHVGSSVEMSFSASGFSGPTSHWGLDDVWLWTYMPVVWLSGGGTSVEDDSQSGAVTVNRSGGPGYWDQPVTVAIRASGGTARPGRDYQTITSATIPANAGFVSVPVIAIDDDEAEPEESAYFSLPGNASYALDKLPATPPAINSTTTVSLIKDEVRNPNYSVTEVSYQASTAAKFLKILPDDSETPFGAVQWKDVDGDGDAGGTDENKFPIGYARSGIAGGTDVFATALPKIKVTNPGDGGNYKIQGLVNAFLLGSWTAVGVYFNEVDATLAGGVVTPNEPLRSAQKVPATIQSGILAITWQVRVVGGGGWQNAGTTSNLMYVAGADAPAAGVKHTVLYLGSRAAGFNPETSASDVVEAIWDEFEDQQVRRVDGRLMTYWGLHAGPQAVAGDLFHTADLLKNADGRCGAWSEFLVDVLRAEGVQAVVSGIIAEVQVVQPRMPQMQPPNGAVTAAIGIYVKPTIPAQGNPTPWGLFLDHAIVKIDGFNSIFDPSYGQRFDAATAPAAEQAWEEASLAGFVWFYKNVAGGVIGISPNAAAQTNGLDETIFAP